LFILLFYTHEINDNKSLLIMSADSLYCFRFSYTKSFNFKKVFFRYVWSEFNRYPLFTCQLWWCSIRKKYRRL